VRKTEARSVTTKVYRAEAKALVNDGFSCWRLLFPCIGIKKNSGIGDDCSIQFFTDAAALWNYLGFAILHFL